MNEKFIIHNSAFIISRSAKLIRRVVQQAHLAREADLSCDVALLLGRQAGVTAAENLAAVADEATELRSALVVESGDELRIEVLALGAQRPHRAAGTGHQSHAKFCS
jgi:hypothetical protein